MVSKYEKVFRSSLKEQYTLKQNEIPLHRPQNDFKTTATTTGNIKCL